MLCFHSVWRRRVLGRRGFYLLVMVPRVIELDSSVGSDLDELGAFCYPEHTGHVLFFPVPL